MSSDRPYLRYPSIRGDLVTFVADDDVWVGSTGGGAARRLTAERAPASFTRLAPDGMRIAYTSVRDGAPEVYGTTTLGGAVRRLTYFGDPYTRVLGWHEDGRVVVASAVGEPFRSRTWAYAVPFDGGPPERLPFGPVTALARRDDGATVLGVDQSTRRGAGWKRYRGGTAGKLWIDADGGRRFDRLLAGLDGQLEDPGWVGDRVVFLSDHQGLGNVYSASADGSGLLRHTDHDGFYARAAATDGEQVVYQCAGDLWLLADLGADSQPTRIDISLGGPRTGRAPHPLAVPDHLGAYAADHDGRASAVEVRGALYWLTHRDGPARVLSAQPGVRARLPCVTSLALADDAAPVAGGPAFAPAAAGSTGPVPPAPPPALVLWVTDADGDDAVEGTVATADRSGEGWRHGAGELGRVLEMAAAPGGAMVAVATHDGRVVVMDPRTGARRTVDRSPYGDASGLSFSPDGRWLAWSHPGPEPLRQIRMTSVPAPAGPDGEAGGAEPGPVVAVTPLRFADSEPVFSPCGRYLLFLSARTFDPVYDEQVFDLSFAAGTRPYLVTLTATSPSPFDAELGGRPRSAPAPAPTGSAGPAGADGAPAGRPVTIDVDGIDQRVVPVPVATGRYRHLRAVHDGVIWLADPLFGVLGESAAKVGGEPPRPSLVHFDLVRRRQTTLLEAVDDVAVTGDGRSLVVRDDKSLRLVPADRKVETGGDAEPDDVVEIDLSRIRFELDPAAEWRQMYEEAARLIRDHFWVDDMAGVDWAAVVDRYRPLLERIATRDDLSDLIWEVQGELGTSHAYETPPLRPVAAERRLGQLGADLVFDEDGGTWSVGRVLPGETSVPSARSPLQAPGVGLRVGTVIRSVDGVPVPRAEGPAALLVGSAEHPVELTVVAPGEGERRVVVVPLADERPLRYHAWVADRRDAVHRSTGTRVGYLHIPDMMGQGWAEFHRDLRVEMARDALVLDLRDNAGGHVSELVLEKLGRAILGWDVSRHHQPTSYPTDSRRGPMVAVVNEQAGSDGDIITAGIRLKELGTVIGTRTWGGVIGIDGRYSLVDGTMVTQPRYSFWFERLGWSVENRGVDPDLEVPFPPQDWAAGTDPQLEAAVALVVRQLEQQPPPTPPDPATRPSRAAPPLPPRPVRSTGS